MRPVLGLWTFSSAADDRPLGFSTCRPTRLVGLDVLRAGFGLAGTTINPSRVMSNPTEIMFVAKATSTPSLSGSRPTPICV